MMKHPLILLFSLSLNFAHAQPSIQWQKCLGGSSLDAASSIVATADGGFVFAGYSNSTNGHVTGHHGSSDNSDCWVGKLDASGTLLWQKSLGGSGQDAANAIAETSNGFIIAGYTSSNSSDVSGNHGSYDAWVARLDQTGNIIWQKCLGGSGYDVANSIQPSADGGFIVAGSTKSSDGSVTGFHGGTGADGWAVKLDGSGDIVWQKCLGGTGDDDMKTVAQAADGSYLLAGFTYSTNGDITFNHGFGDGWIVQLDAAGEISWQTCIGGSAYEAINSILPTSDGFIVAGNTSSYNGDVNGNHGGMEAWIVKMSNGAIDWQRCLGGTSTDVAKSIVESGGNYAIAGYTQSTNGDVIENCGGSDFWAVMVSTDGTSISSKCMGGIGSEESWSLVETVDGGFAIAGTSNSNDQDVSGNQGGGDCWVVRLDASDWSLGIDELQIGKVGSFRYFNLLGQPLENPEGLVLKVYDSGFTEKVYLE